MCTSREHVVLCYYLWLKSLVFEVWYCPGHLSVSSFYKQGIDTPITLVLQTSLSSCVSLFYTFRCCDNGACLFITVMCSYYRTLLSLYMVSPIFLILRQIYIEYLFQSFHSFSSVSSKTYISVNLFQLAYTWVLLQFVLI